MAFEIKTLVVSISIAIFINNQNIAECQPTTNYGNDRSDGSCRFDIATLRRELSQARQEIVELSSEIAMIKEEHRQALSGTSEWKSCRWPAYRGHPRLLSGKQNTLTVLC